MRFLFGSSRIVSLSIPLRFETVGVARAQYVASYLDDHKCPEHSLIFGRIIGTTYMQEPRALAYGQGKLVEV